MFLFHPLTTHFPIALWVTSFLFDILSWRRRHPLHSTIALYLIGLGLLAAPMAIATAWVDYLRLLQEGVGGPFMNLHFVHSILSYGTTAFYLGSFLLRWRASLSPSAQLALGLMGAFLISATGWYGGELLRTM